MRRYARTLLHAIRRTPLTVIRKVDASGNVSFAAFTYRVGHRFRNQPVEVRVTANTVEISQQGRVIRTWVIPRDSL